MKENTSQEISPGLSLHCKKNYGHFSLLRSILLRKAWFAAYEKSMQV